MKAFPSSQVRAKLADQRAGLRERIRRCEELADALDAGQIGPMQLLHEVTRLRIAFDAHNQREGQRPRAALPDADAPGPFEIAHLAGDHAHEHRPVKRQLGSAPVPTSELRAALDSLRAHLDVEEHSFVATRARRDQVFSA
jgi:hypothetical protein